MSDYKLVIFSSKDFDAYQRLVNSNVNAPVNAATQAHWLETRWLRPAICQARP